MEGIRGRFERSLMKRVADKLEEARAKFWTKIYAAINEVKRFELDAKREAKDI